MRMTEQYRHLMRVYSKHGYDTVADIARELHRQNYTRSDDSSYLGKIFRDQTRRIPLKLETGLLALCENDPIVAQWLGFPHAPQPPRTKFSTKPTTRRRTNARKTLDYAFTSAIMDLRAAYDRSDEHSQLELILTLERMGRQLDKNQENEKAFIKLTNTQP